MRKEQQESGKLPGYDRFCRRLSPSENQEKLTRGESYVIRLKVPDNQEISFNDLIMGEIKINSSVLDDQVLLKSDGFPTYHLAVVVDDHLMEINYVIRGNEWISSTPKHMLLYEAFGWPAPKYAHLPVFLDPSGEGKMSKRKGSVSARSFLDDGYLPEAMLNYLMLLGWNPGTEKEIFNLEEFIVAFDIKNLNKSNPKFTYDKLNWFNQHYIRSLDDQELARRLAKFTSRSEKEILSVLPLVKDRLVTLKDFEELSDYFFDKPVIDKALFDHLKVDAKEVLGQVIKTLQGSWDGKVLEEKAREYCAKEKIKVGDYFMVLRVAVTGKTTTPPLWEIMKLLGKKETLLRLALARKTVS